MLRVSELSNLNYNTIFYSAFKALVVFEYLLTAPKTLTQIQEYLSTLPFIKAKVSTDTLRVYINSFISAGCTVEKKTNQGKKREYTYFIPESPFTPQLSKVQAKRLFDIYDMVMYNLSFEDLVKVDLLISRFNHYSKSEDFHKLYSAHSIIKDFDRSLLLELQRCCENNYLVTVLYNSPRSGLKEIPIIAHKMKIQNYKLYLEGFGMEYNQEGIFLVSRITKITNVISSEDVRLSDDNFFEITFELYDENVELQPGETLISEENGIRIVKHATSNKVLTTHRFLQLEDSAKILATRGLQS